MGCVTTFGEEAVIPGNRQASWAYAESFLAEDEVLRLARQRAKEVGAVPVSPGTGAALALLAAATGARAVAEIGTGTGVSGVWLLRGMRLDATLTSIDADLQKQRIAREVFTAAGFASSRARLIPGLALEVLPRLADGGYDLVFCDGPKTEYPAYVEEAERLLRPGGIAVFDNAFWHDRVLDPSLRDPDTLALRDVLKSLRDDERFSRALLPVGDGLLCAVKR